MPLAHISLPVTDLKASKTFYLSLLKPLGYEIYKEFDAVIGMAPKMGAPDFWMHVCPEAEKKAGGALKVQKTHVAFQASSKGDVHAFYEAAL
jgi:catechol 2,3-dioxygenase-like lactoylglutathione lyase family enzyme